jgi:hypothetical protein
MSETELPSSLQSAIEDLYSVFDRYHLRPHVEGCEHCVFPDDHVRLGAKSLRALAPADLSLFAWKAMSTWGTVEDYKHFLPRISELMLRGAGHPFDMDTLAWKLADGQWQLWRFEEQGALNALFRELWNWILASEATEPYELDLISADRFLLCMSRVADISPFLARWRVDRSTKHAEHLGKFVFENVEDLARRHTLGDPWESHPEHMRLMIAWLFDDHTLPALEHALTAYAERWNPKALPNLSARLHEAYSARLALKAEESR